MSLQVRAAAIDSCRERTLDRRLGSLQLCIPKPRQATYFPPFLELTKCGADNESRRLNSAKTRRRKKMHQ